MPTEHLYAQRVNGAVTRVGRVVRVNGATADFAEVAPVRCAFTVPVLVQDLVDLGACRD